MIDTIILIIEGLEISDKHLVYFKQIKSVGVIKYVFNPDPTQIYMPTITISKNQVTTNYYTRDIVIQFSVPKLVRGSSYFGVDETDYERVVDVLSDKMCRIFNGQPISKEIIKKANIRNIAFSFNFIMPPNFGYPAEFLKIIPFLDIGKRYGQTKDTYYTEGNRFGFCGRIYNKQIGWKMYDKGAEVIDKAKNFAEKQIASCLKAGVLQDKILRMEVTFQHRTTLKKRLGKMIDGNEGKERCLREVFDNKLCQRILLDFFDKLANDLNVFAMDTPLYPISEFLEKAQKSGMSLYDAYAWIGHSFTVQQIGSYQQKLFGDNYYSRQERCRAEKKLKKLISVYTIPPFTIKKVFDECRKQLLDFKIIKPQGP